MQLGGVGHLDYQRTVGIQQFVGSVDGAKRQFHQQGIPCAERNAYRIRSGIVFEHRDQFLEQTEFSQFVDYPGIYTRVRRHIGYQRSYRLSRQRLHEFGIHTYAENIAFRLYLGKHRAPVYRGFVPRFRSVEIEYSVQGIGYDRYQGL